MLKKWFCRFIVLSSWYIISGICYSQDMKVKLNSADGSTSFQVRNSNDVVVSTITSDGFIGTAGDMQIAGSDLFFSVWGRRIYDEPANYVIGVSTNLYVTGNLQQADGSEIKNDG
ncbi:MAG: hypothetical protein KKD35_01065, partial [Elusimicrobia bacterium]|nr:hypothetical protein [Elusimicrobiota bacterium]